MSDDRDGATENIEVTVEKVGRFVVVKCFYCYGLMRGPFNGGDWWEFEELHIRKFNRCNHCGMRNRVSRGIQRRVSEE